MPMIINVYITKFYWNYNNLVILKKIMALWIYYARNAVCGLATVIRFGITKPVLE
jgi:hypothetical protein